MLDGLKIDELAELTGVTRRTIRYYVASGLLPSPGPRGVYGEEHFERLEAIKRLQVQRLSLNEIREQLAPLSGSRPLENAAQSQPSKNGNRLAAAAVDPSTQPIDPAGWQEVAMSSNLTELRYALAEDPARESLVHAAYGRIVPVVAVILAIAALSIAVVALHRTGGSQAKPQLATPDACAAFTGYANQVGQLAGILLGPSPPRVPTTAEVQELMALEEEALTVREKACAQK